MTAITETVLALSATPWCLVLLLACCYVDGFFPPIPSEILVTGLAAMAVAGGSPNIVAVVAVAAFGAFLGDLTAYGIGRRVRLAPTDGAPAGHLPSLLRRTAQALVRHPAEVLLAARFVPGARVAVTMTAGGVRFSIRRFVALVSISSMLWAGYTSALGAGAGSVFRENPLLAGCVGVVVGLAVGVLLDRVARLRRARSVPAGGARAELGGL